MFAHFSFSLLSDSLIRFTLNVFLFTHVYNFHTYYTNVRTNLCTHFKLPFLYKPTGIPYLTQNTMTRDSQFVCCVDDCQNHVRRNELARFPADIEDAKYQIITSANQIKFSCNRSINKFPPFDKRWCHHLLCMLWLKLSTVKRHIVGLDIW